MSAPSSHRRADCRLCGGRRLELALKLAPTPPANAFVPAEKLAEPQRAYPLDLFLCLDCAHLQLLDVVDPAALFEDYVYVSGTSPVFVEHFRQYAELCVHKYALEAGRLAVDVGSNDGTLLRFFQEHGLKVLGVDPAKEIAARATGSGVETMAAFFTLPLARELKAVRGPAAIVTANNVFAHSDKLAEIAEGIRELLDENGVFVFEVSYLVDVYEKTLFDTIYHEHVAYHSVRPLVPFLARCGLELIEAERVGTHGGSLRGVAQLKGGPRPVGASVAKLVALEDRLGLHEPETWAAFSKNIDQRKGELAAMLAKVKAQGKRVAGFGAPAKATTLMHHFGLGKDQIEFIVDDSPLKQGLYTPGLHVPVLPPRALEERRPDYLLILAWNFAPSIVQKNRRFVDEGGRFIVPLPKVEMIG